MTRTTKTPTSPPRTIASPLAILVITTIASVLNPFISTSINLALPSIGRDLVVSDLALGWITNSYLLLSAILLIPLGAVADRTGHLKLFKIGLVIFGSANLFCTIAPSTTTLIVARFAKGVGGACLYATTLPILCKAYPLEKRGRVLGINLSAVSLALSMGPFVGGLLTRNFTWRYIFAATALSTFLLLFYTLWKLPLEEVKAKEKDPSIGKSTDLFGSLLYLIALGAFIIGLTRLKEPFTAEGNWASALLFPLGCFLLVLFFLYERQHKAPILDTNLFLENKIFSLSALAAAVIYASDFVINYILSFYLQRVSGLDAGLAGIILMSQPLAMTLVSPLAGRWSDKIHPSRVATLGAIIMGGGLLLLGTLTTSTPIGVIVVAEIIVGIGFGTFLSPNANSIMSAAPPQQYGTASATLGSMRQIGQSTGISVAMLIITLIPTTKGIVLYTTQTTQTVMTFSLLACTAGIFLSLLSSLKRKKKSSKKRKITTP